MCFRGGYCLVKLTIEGVDCYYGSTKVLESVSFQIKSGDFVGIIGPNGSGKTTLLKCISGVLKPRVGTVLIDEYDLDSLSRREIARYIAVVPQESYIGFSFKVLDVVLMGRHPHIEGFKSESKHDLKVAYEAMRLTGILHLADKPVTEISGGEKQRVIIARALTQEPKILLLDEPTLHLDLNHQIEIMSLLKELCEKNGLVVLAVFHDFNLAAKYCDSLILLSKGKIVALGSCEEVLTSKNIEKVFGIRVVVKHHPITGSLYVVPVFKPPKFEDKKPLKGTVHVVCGGGSGSYLIRLLVEEGYRVTAGVLHMLDSDYETAEAFNIPVVCEAPFSPITDENHQNNLNLMEKADLIIVTDVPFGHFNLKNLEAVKTVLEKRKKKVLVVEGEANKKRDFTGGKAEAILDELRRKGVLFTKNYEEALALAKKLVA